MSFFELKVSEEEMETSKKRISKLMEQGCNSLRNPKNPLYSINGPEVEAIKWVHHPKFSEGLDTQNPSKIAELLFEQNDFLKSDFQDDEVSPRSVVAAVGVAVVAAVTLAAALHVEVLTVSNRYMTTTTKVWGRTSLTWIDKVLLTYDQNNILLAIKMTCDDKFIDEIIKCYRASLIKYAKSLTNSHSSLSEI